MREIAGWEHVNENGEFRRLPAGIYGVVITNVVDVPEKEYLEIYCDITKGEFKDYFKTLVANGLKDNSKSCRSYKTNALSFFKGFITAVEKTNAGYHWDWNEKGLIGKNVMAVFGEEEYLDKDGNVKIATKLVEFRSYEAYKEGKITVPPLKKYDGPVVVSEPTLVNTNTNDEDDELPF